MELETRKQELEAKYHAELEQLYKKNEIYQKTGLEPSFLSMRTTSFKPQSLEELKKLREVYPPTQNFQLTFAGKEPQITEGKYGIKFMNYPHTREVDMTAVWYNEELGNIWADLPSAAYADWVSSVYMRATDQNSDLVKQYARKETNGHRGKLVEYYYYHNYITALANIRYYGGTIYNYATTEENSELLENILFNPKETYENEANS